MTDFIVVPQQIRTPDQCPICLHAIHAHLRLSCGWREGRKECICRGPIETRPRRPIQQ